MHCCVYTYIISLSSAFCVSVCGNPTYSVHTFLDISCRNTHCVSYTCKLSHTQKRDDTFPTFLTAPPKKKFSRTSIPQKNQNFIFLTIYLSGLDLRHREALLLGYALADLLGDVLGDVDGDVVAALLGDLDVFFFLGGGFEGVCYAEFI